MFSLSLSLSSLDTSDVVVDLSRGPVERSVSGENAIVVL